MVLVAAISAASLGEDSPRIGLLVFSLVPPRFKQCLADARQRTKTPSCSKKWHLNIVARGVIGNTPGFDPGIPSSSLGGPVPPTMVITDKQR